jgi:antibiotic biosynthesis monooxygenase
VTTEPITTIVHFEVPPENVDRFFAFWRDHVKDAVSMQSGLIGGVFHRGLDPDGPFQFINVAHWSSAEQLEAGLAATNQILPEMAQVFQDLGVKISQNNYAEVVRYGTAGGATSTR